MPESLSLTDLRARLRSGLVIPAHPLALDTNRRFDERRMRALTRYYLAAGCGGLAVAVHTTQFAIRDPRHGLLRPVLENVARTVDSVRSSDGEPIVLIAGICGDTAQAVAEARIASELGYDAGLVSLAGRASSAPELISHIVAVAEVIPVVGFYLQTAVGGIRLDRDFWRRFAQIGRVAAIKIAPFNRYATIDVVRAVAESGRAQDIALYTGNDDNIVADLLTQFVIDVNGEEIAVEIVGGLLGQWACWTRRAVEIHAACRHAVGSRLIPADLLTTGARLTEANAAIFDVDNGFGGSIPGVHEVLRRQGLLDSTACLDAGETLSRGQMERITAICSAYPDLTDDTFVAQHLPEWME